MKLEEKIKELKQLDRIEYRQKKEIINGKYEVGFFSSMVNLALIVLGFFYLLLFISYETKDVFMSGALVTVLLVFLKTFIIAIVLFGVLDVITLCYKNKANKELNEEYFEVNIIKK